ncbi:MAG: hypothetical protein OEY14_15235 [Myxococcales bacterium]|nr:hypothetical protein [Myxococcales bacterium]
MDLKRFMVQKSMGLLQDPRVQKVMQDDRVIKAMMKAFEMRGRVQAAIDARADGFARSLNLATKKELRELRRTVRRMEQELREAREGEDGSTHGRVADAR